MRINSVNSNIKFASHYTNVDIGASSILGSLKIAVVDENGNLIAKNYHSTVFDENEDRNEDKFERNVAKKIAEFEKNNAEIIKQADKSNSSKLTICYPGPKLRSDNNDALFFLSNFAYDANRHKKFKRPINASNIDSYLRQANINVVQSRHANDMAGAGACLLSRIKEKCPHILQEGEEILFMYPGGGLGTGMIIVDKDNIKIKPTEIQHTIKNWTANEAIEENVKAKKLRDNFADELELDDQERALLKENTKVVDNYDELRAILPYISLEEFQEASKAAILKYMDSLAQVIATKVCDSKLNTVVITGPIANGLRKSVNNNPRFRNFTTENENDNFKATLKRKVTKNLTKVGNENILKDPDRLNIVFLDIPNNTEAAHMLQQGEEVGNPTAWYNIYN